MSSRRPLACSIGLVLAALALPLHAWELGYSLATALGYSDNINQSATDPTGQAMLIPRLDFDFNEDGAYLRARAVGQVEYRDYLQGAFGNEVRGQLSGIATWIILPQRLSFDFEDYAAVQPVDLLAANSPGNQQQTNVFTLGPTFNFRLYQTLNGQAELRLTQSTASQTHEFDSTRGSAALRVLKDLTKLDRVSGNIEYQDVHFIDRGGGPDYRRADAYARYQSKLAQLDLDLGAGYSRLDFAHGGAHGGALLRGAVNWHATPSQTFTLSAARQFSDAAVDLVVDPAAWLAQSTGGGIVSGTTPINSQVYLERRIDAAWAYQSERVRLRVQPYERKLAYLLDPTLDETAHGLIAGISYRARPLWTLAFDAGAETRSYSFIDRRDQDRHYDLSFTDQLARHWSVRIDLIRNERHSTVSEQEFRENVLFCTVIFKR